MMCRNKELRLVRMPNMTYPPARPRCLRHGPGIGGRLRCKGCAFTVIEILIVLVILAIAALTAIPMMSSAGSVQVRAAANMIAADLEYAKSMAISRGQDFFVVFDAGTESYGIEDQDNNTISHPVKTGFPYVIDFKNQNLEKVDITNVDFGGTSQVKFDYLGSPDNAGTVRIEAGGTVATISVELITGYIAVTN